MPAPVHRVRPLLAILALCCGVAHADVGLLPPASRTMGADEARTTRAVVDVAREVLKGRLRPVASADVAPDHARCLAEATCRAALLERLAVEELAEVTVTPTTPPDEGAFAAARLVVWTAEGVGFDATVPLSTDRELRGLLTRAFDPGRATARLDIEGVAADDVILIDGLRADVRNLLASGAHTVVVQHGDGTRTTLPLTLGFEERRFLVVPTRTAKAAWEAFLWPVVVGGAVGVAGAVGAGVGGVLLAGGINDGRQRDVLVAATASAGVVGALGLVAAAISLLPAPAPEVTP